MLSDMLQKKVVEGVLFVGVFINSCSHTLSQRLHECLGGISLRVVRENFHTLDSSCLREFGKPRTVEVRPVIGSSGFSGLPKLV